ncbi:TetR family transcriptional regulator [Burkholderia sp. SFA1]|uniref:TetR/AcrR family transcriptional regulator n=1 Tax=unclassified Caballeronia TaxID=2646786 RepID=UPI001F1CC78B|nr:MULTISPECIES: TetR/AcrR family transcriptional regulator [unclassified Caballeronia]MCE4543956.1 TetR/AcrR family transcriptional regulator [Caballeronia sp. PC1]MCE4571107.1 TetR/AcrR family transcriptional regulator [Caballeronia sp. CLC5]BBP98977.1 TetR family transcriptional regulator [Burkholderia sp. SFA1]
MDQIVDTNRSSPETWLDAAYDNLLEGGIDSVRILPLAKKLNLSRTSFYWFFKDREELLAALLNRWKAKNTGNWIERTQAYAETINEAVLNVTDCWFDDSIFDSRYEAAMRSWAQQSPEVARETADDDERRIAALVAMFERFEYEHADADVRARAMYYTQLGYLASQPNDPMTLRMSRISAYAQLFTSVKPTERELERFFARRKMWPTMPEASKKKA